MGDDLPEPGCREVRVTGARRQREGACHCACWSKTYSGGDCAKASQSGKASTGGPCTGLIHGGPAGSPISVRIHCTEAVYLLLAVGRRDLRDAL